MRARLRAPGGTSTIILPDDATVSDLLAEITVKTSITEFDIKYGYPPKPLLLEQSQKSQPLNQLSIKLDGEQLTISPKEDPAANKATPVVSEQTRSHDPAQKKADPPKPFSFGNIGSSPEPAKTSRSSGLVSLKKKAMDGDVPEIPFPERGATVVLRVMPDDNSCLFRALGTAVVPGDDLSMPELRSLVAGVIQSDPETYSRVVLEQSPDDYCRWIQTQDAWGGAIELGILSKHFETEICSIDVQSLRVDKFNEGAKTRCILVYSGVHYDTIVQSPSEPPHTKADNPPELDVRVWDKDDDEILIKALELCRQLKDKHYFTDTGGMALKCETCGIIVYGQGQAQGHAQQTGHYDMQEIGA